MRAAITTAARARHLPSPAQVHVTKMRDARYNPTGLPWTGMCVDAASIMGARLAGADVARWGARTPQQLLEHARRLSVGRGASPNLQDGVSEAARKAVFDDLGVASRHTDDIDEALRAMRRGNPIVLNGYASQAGTWHARFAPTQVVPDGHHAVAASWDARRGAYVVNDPNSRIGPIDVSERELRTFAHTPPVDFQTGATILTPLR